MTIKFYIFFSIFLFQLCNAYFKLYNFLLLSILYYFYFKQLIIKSYFFSRQFGFLKLNSSEQAKKKALVVRAIKYLERMLVQAQSEKQRRKADSTKSNLEDSKDDDEDDDEEDKGISIDPKTYCKLGHFHLLLEDYNKGK